MPQIPAKKLVPDSPAKVFSLRRSLQWAVAACLAGVLVAGAYLLNNAPSSSLPSPAALGVVEDQDLTHLGEQEMDQYLQTQAQLSLLSAESTEDLNLDPASKMEQLTEDELLQYLQQEETTAAVQLAS
ncbi:MAG: hypothetical protein EAZ62_09085 [Sphingobacteriia bacterium]|nr:MAG: hypothetical protein EAZ62_09085 [Sphingobacteriia bacterium]